MIIKTLVENTALSKNFGSEHGLSLYIEANSHKILFDVGASELFLENAKKLNVDISEVDYLIISHGHYDHGGGRCHDNAKCESLWGRFKEELLYDRYDAKKMSMAAVKSLIWRYFMSYWNNRRICSANGGLPPMVKRKKFYERQYAKTA
jgi:mRNA degradation ribonuclease J1/J2